MNQTKLSILRVPRRPGAGQALVQSAEAEDQVQAQEAALKARAALKEEYESRHQHVNIYAQAEPMSEEESATEHKACINASGRITATSNLESEESPPPRPGKGRVTSEWTKQSSRTPWALDNEEPTTITKITQHNVKGITW